MKHLALIMLLSLPLVSYGEEGTLSSGDISQVEQTSEGLTIYVPVDTLKLSYSPEDPEDTEDTEGNEEGCDGSGEEGTLSSTGYCKPVTEEPKDDTPEVPDECKDITGYKPECTTTTPVEWFAFGSARPITFSGANFGSDNPQSKQFYNVPAGGILVHSMNMSSEPLAGRVLFGPSGNISGVSLRMWVSTSPDGPMLSGCGYVGYVEAVFNLSTDGSTSCNLSPGGSYYLNLAICNSVPGDLYCNDPSATTPETGARLVMRSRY